GKDLTPDVFGVAQDRGEEIAGLIARRRVARGPRLRRLLILLLPAALQDLRAANQNSRIDAERPAEQAEHDDRSDPESASRKPHAATAKSAATAAVVLDIFASTEIIPAHETLPNRSEDQNSLASNRFLTRAA